MILPQGTIGSLQISESNKPSECSISVVVTNTGRITGAYTVHLEINDALESKDVTLAGGASQKVTFIAYKDVAETYSVKVNGLESTFTVTTVVTAEPENKHDNNKQQQHGYDDQRNK